MGRPKETKFYSDYYLDLADQLSTHPEKSVTVECADEQEVEAIRLEFYSFRSCAIKEDLTSMYPELTSLVTRQEKNKLIFMHKNFTPSMMKLRKAIDSSKKEDGNESR